MAKKKDDYSDDINFDDDMDFGDLDNLDDNSFGDIDANLEGDRKPTLGSNARYIAKEVFSADSARSIGKKVGYEFQGTGRMGSSIAETMSQADTLKNSVLKDINPTILQLKRSGKLLLPKVEKLIPSKAYNKIQKMLKTEDEYRQESEFQQRENSIASSVGEIFQLQAEQVQEIAGQDRVDKIIQNKVDEGRHSESLSVLSQIRNLTKSNQQFFQGEYRKYLMKSLELKYRHLYVAKDTFESLRGLSLLIEAKLTGIQYNTGLPDYVKRTKSEFVSEQMRQRLIGDAYSTISETTNNLRETIFKNIKSKVTDNFVNMFNDLGNSAEDVSSMSAQQEEMDAMMREYGDGKEDPKASKGTKVAGWLMKQLFVNTGLIGARSVVGNQRFKDIDEMMDHANKSVREKAQYYSDSKRGTFLGDLVGMIVPRIEEERNVVKNNFTGNANEEVFYDNLSRKAQTEVIPGLLRKIQFDTSNINEIVRATSSARLDPAQKAALDRKLGSIEELVFDEKSETFVKTSEYKERVQRKVFGTSESRTERLGSLVDELRAGFAVGKGDDAFFEKYFTDIVTIINNLTKHGKTLDGTQLRLIDRYLNGKEEDLEGHEKYWLDWVFKSIPNNKRKQLAKILKTSFFRNVVDDDGVVEEKIDQPTVARFGELLRIERNYKDDAFKIMNEDFNSYGNKQVWQGDLVNKELTQSEILKLTRSIKQKYRSKYGTKRMDQDKELQAMRDEEIRRRINTGTGLNHDRISEIFNDVDIEKLKGRTGHLDKAREREEGIKLREEEDELGVAGRVKKSFKETKEAYVGAYRNLADESSRQLGAFEVGSIKEKANNIKNRVSKAMGMDNGETTAEGADSIAGDIGAESHDSFKITDPGLYVQGVKRELHLPITEAEEKTFKDLISKAKSVADVKKIIGDIISSRPEMQQDGVINSAKDITDRIYKRANSFFNKDNIKAKAGNFFGRFKKNEDESLEADAVELSAMMEEMPTWTRNFISAVTKATKPEERKAFNERILKDMRAFKVAGYTGESLKEEISKVVPEWFGSLKSKLPAGMQKYLDSLSKSIKDLKGSGGSIMERLATFGGRWKEGLKGLITGKADGFEARTGIKGLWDRSKFYMKTTGDAGLRGMVGDERAEGIYANAKKYLPGIKIPGMDSEAMQKAKKALEVIKGKVNTVKDAMPNLEYLEQAKHILNTKNLNTAGKIQAIKDLGEHPLANKVLDLVAKGDKLSKMSGEEFKENADQVYNDLKNDAIGKYENAKDFADVQVKKAKVEAKRVKDEAKRVKDAIKAEAKQKYKEHHERSTKGGSVDVSEVVRILSEDQVLSKERHETLVDFIEAKKLVDDEILKAIRVGIIAGDGKGVTSADVESVTKSAWYKPRFGRKDNKFVYGVKDLIGGTIGRIFGLGKKMTKGSFDLLGNIIGGSGRFVKNVGIGAGSFLGGAGKLIGNGIGGVAGGFGNAIGGMAKGSGTAISGIAKGLGTAAAGLGPAIGGIAKGAGNALKGAGSAIGGALSGAGSYFSGIPTSIIKGGVDLAGKGLGAVTGLFGKKGYQKDMLSKTDKIILLLERIQKNTRKDIKREGSFEDYQDDEAKREGALKAKQDERRKKLLARAGGAAADGEGEEGGGGGIADYAMGAGGAWVLGKIKDIGAKLLSKKPPVEGLAGAGAKVAGGGSGSAGIVANAVTKMLGLLPERFVKFMKIEKIGAIVARLGKKTLFKLAAKFAGPIGIAYAAYTASKAMLDAYDNAELISGRGDLTTVERLTIALSGGIDDFLLGIPGVGFISGLLGVKSSAEKILNANEEAAGNPYTEDSASMSDVKNSIDGKLDGTGKTNTSKGTRNVTGGGGRSGGAGASGDYSVGKKNTKKIGPSDLPVAGGIPPEFHAKIKEWIKGQEGLVLKPYMDTTGHNTVGYGHLNDDGYGEITMEEADALFDMDYKEHFEQAMSIPGANKLNPARLASLVNMVFNQGKGGVLEYKNTLAAMNAGDYEGAKAGIMDSKAAREQIGNRAKEIADVMASGNMADIHPHPATIWEGGVAVGVVDPKRNIKSGAADDAPESTVASTSTVSALGIPTGNTDIAASIDAAAPSTDSAVTSAITTKAGSYSNPVPIAQTMKELGIKSPRGASQDATTEIVAANQTKLKLMSNTNELLERLIVATEKKSETQGVHITTDQLGATEKIPKYPTSSSPTKASNVTTVNVASAGTGVDFSRKLKYGS